MTGWPSGKQLGYPPGVIGEEFKVDSPRAGVVDDGLVAWPERIEQARKLWPEGRATDFERLSRREWRDKATGTTFRRISGSPLLQALSEPVDCWFIGTEGEDSGRLVFLIHPDRIEQVRTVQRWEAAS